MRKISKIFLVTLFITLLYESTCFAAPSQMADGGFFDPVFYANTYPDIAAAIGTEPEVLYQHFVNSGSIEGRLPYAPNAIIPVPLVYSAPDFIVSTQLGGGNIQIGEALTFKCNVVSATNEQFYLNWLWYGNTDGIDVQTGDFFQEIDGSWSIYYTVFGIYQGTYDLYIYIPENPNAKVCVKIGVGLDEANKVSLANVSIPQTGSEDYLYLVESDFRRIRRSYSTAKANGGYALPYVGEDGKLYVLTYVSYTIISQYDEYTLHNMTDGTYYIDPEHMYDDAYRRAYGAGKITVLNKQQEILSRKGDLLNAYLNILKYGANTGYGAYISSYALNLYN